MEVRGYVVGRWGEVSEDFHHLVHDLASARALAADMMSDRGWGVEGQLSEEGHLAHYWVIEKTNIISWCEKPS